MTCFRSRLRGASPRNVCRCDLSKSDGYVCRLGATGRTIRLATECLDLCCVCLCWPAWLSHFLSFPFSFSPLSLRGREATDNTRTTLISYSTVCQSTLTDTRARTTLISCTYVGRYQVDTGFAQQTAKQTKSDADRVPNMFYTFCLQHVIVTQPRERAPC